MLGYVVVAPQGLGDSLEATAFLRALRDARPEARIDVAATRPAARELFGGLPKLVDGVIYLPYWEKGALAFARALLAQRFARPARYDAAFLMYPAARGEYHVLTRVLGARRRYAHRYWPSKYTRLQWLHTDLVDIERKHNVLRNLDLLRAAGIDYRVPDSYAVPQSWKATGVRNGLRIVLHVGTIAHHGLESRRWPIAYFVRLAEWLVSRGYDVVAVMGPAEERETRELQMLVPAVHVFHGDLAETARMISTARLAITNDSGIAHLAAAVGTENVALFGPTPLEHAPYGANVTALRPSACPPCFDVRRLNTECALGIDYACLKKDLQPDYVIASIADRLNRHATSITGETVKSATSAVDSASAK